LDTNLKPWLLEINYTPSFTADTPLDERIKCGVVSDALKLTNFQLNIKQEIIKN
jgi:tubulin polyglutamylase TTLL6/13